MFTAMPAPPHDIAILREDDPRHDRLLSEGWTIVGQSWGARLQLGDGANTQALDDAVAQARTIGYQVSQLGETDVPDIRNLFEQVLPDFPQTPATKAIPLPEDLDDLLAEGAWLAFGARSPDGTLVAFTTLFPQDDRWEVDRTAVRTDHRLRGLAKAVKAESILATHAMGARRWGTGGAAANEGSLAMNAALGFELEPRWHSLARPIA